MPISNTFALLESVPSSQDQMVTDPPLLTTLLTESSSDHPTDPVEALAFLSNPLTPISSTRLPIENPNSSLDFLHLVPRLTSESDEDGRILIIWKDPMKVRVVHQSSQRLTCLLELQNKDPFYYTAVHASNLCANRADLWAELIYLSNSYDLQNNQWFVGGDFNQILQPLEHSSPTVSVPNSLMYQFQDCILQAGLFDLSYNAFPHASVTFLPPSISDHTPCLLDLAVHLPKAGTQPFKFQNYLTKHPNFTMERVKETYCLLQTVQKRNTVPEPLKKGLLVLSSISSTKIQPVDPTIKAQFESIATIASAETGPQIGSEIPTAPVHSEETHVPILNFITINPKSSSPIITNKASSSQPTNPPASTTDPSLETNPPPVTLPPTLPMPTQTTPSEPSLVERLRISEDKTLKRLAPVTISETGRPRVLIPDSVFEKGAAIHKDFIICYYNGRLPPFNQIQSVFNHMWGKGKKLEIHNNPRNISTLVRIPNDYLRQKILEKNIWYVGDSMFHTAQWSSEHSMSTPPLKAIKIWAHLTGVPLDRRHQEGLSLVAGLVDDPKETDDFTRNLVSLTLSHVKVEVDLTQPLPSAVEFQRQS
ncbi:hypothetical protein DY000_02004944 [Brassica cretica]|uniref:DUF4283 domain-containing protein n=1 Tax=Brassica cretica TaxID=69181 RepID=A0ABQ7C7S8_BRACR|nr:hypothetical protein DY000_02004944 [Brassica cretica]